MPGTRGCPGSCGLLGPTSDHRARWCSQVEPPPISKLSTLTSTFGFLGINMVVGGSSLRRPALLPPKGGRDVESLCLLKHNFPHLDLTIAQTLQEVENEFHPVRASATTREQICTI